MSNSLKHETSPYLLQHAENPVNWYPWREDAFLRAKEENKPVFLSIGYSTCHWCHVMAHESFEDTEIAELLNRHFISIKVDKEERPDIDSIYMSVCQAFTGSGGWPASIFMTPEQKPFFAGTYFPKGSRGEMLGFRELLSIIHEKWDTDRDTLINQADDIVRALGKRDIRNVKANMQLSDSAVTLYKKAYDKTNGGFNGAPKFPSPHNLMFLLTYYEKYKDPTCLEMAEHTLMQMYRGGLFDHIGYGFCRYSTDAVFLVPHFEKMLYDNAMLILAYCKLYSATKNSAHLEIARKTASYILRKMTSPEGGFYSAQDADSEGEEGKYYLFTPDEIIGLLGDENGKAFNRHFDISEKGNFEGKNIPNLLKSDISDKSFDSFLLQIEDYRQKRYRLHLDDKILTAWNGLMIAAMCHLYRACGDSVYLDAAKQADKFIQDNLFNGNTLFVSFRAGKRGKNGFLDDYAAYIFAQLALYEATFDTKYLKRVEDLYEYVFSSFSDNADGGFFLYGAENEELILRPKETYDGAVPSGNSLMAWNLVRLSQLIGGKYDAQAVRQLDFIASDASHYPSGYAMFLTALLEYYDPAPKVTVVLANPDDAVNLPFILPSNYVSTVLTTPTDEFPLKDGKTTFYVCKNYSCLPPVNDISELV